MNKTYFSSQQHVMSSSASADSIAHHDVESGYASGSSHESSVPDVAFTKKHLRFLNKQLARLEPEEILRWCLTTLPSLYQTTAFGLTGLVILDMLSKISKISKNSPDLIFLDTLHHFSETLALVDQVRKRYPGTTLHVYRPQDVDTEEDFTARHGARLWETNDELYDWIAKVEPAQRAYRELQVKAVLTGRRRSQGGQRGEMEVLEIDEAGLIKVNPLAGWSFDRVAKYIKENGVPYNELIDQGYKSIGDWHSTQPTQAGEDERAGRWRGQQKTECGIHNKKSRYAQFLMEQELKAKSMAGSTEDRAMTDSMESLTV